jgi:hypothetical protein
LTARPRRRDTRELLGELNHMVVNGSKLRDQHCRNKVDLRQLKHRLFDRRDEQRETSEETLVVVAHNGSSTNPAAVKRERSVSFVPRSLTRAQSAFPSPVSQEPVVD